MSRQQHLHCVECARQSFREQNFREMLRFHQPGNNTECSVPTRQPASLHPCPIAFPPWPFTHPFHPNQPRNLSLGAWWDALPACNQVGAATKDTLQS